MTDYCSILLSIDRLEQDGYSCDCVRSAEEVLTWLQTEKPDIITLDILLPGMDGWSFLEVIRQNDHLNDIPIVIVSIQADEYRGFALGASRVLTKPVDKNELLHAITTLKLKSSNHHLTALTIDDDKKSLKLIERHLQSEGFEVMTANGGQKGHPSYSPKSS